MTIEFTSLPSPPTVARLIEALKLLPQHLPIFVEGHNLFDTYLPVVVIQNEGGVVIRPDDVKCKLPNRDYLENSWQKRTLNYLARKGACNFGLFAFWNWVAEENPSWQVPDETYTDWARLNLDLKDLVTEVPEIPDEWLREIWTREAIDVARGRTP